MSNNDQNAENSGEAGGSGGSNPDSRSESSITRTVDSAAVDAEVGQYIGRYKLLEKVGEGGFGVVYVAEQREPVKRRVALKIIKVGMDTKEVVARFESERQALAMMDHPNIAKVLDAGTTESGRPFFAMELVRGIKITKYCDQHRLSTRERLELCIQVCQAVQHAHQKGIIHRDLKPSNILITLHDGVPVPKVIDFGIAKATQQELTNKTVYTQLHQFVGTPSYMSPEQAEMSGLDIDTRSDIYSLGVLIYEILTGRPPFDGKELLKRGVDEMIRTIREVEAPRPSTQVSGFSDEERSTAAKRRGMEATKLARQLRGDLDWVVMKCLEKDRTRRYESANALASDIRRYLGNELVTARPASAGYRARKWIRRNKVAATTAGLVLLSLMGGLAFSSAALLREKLAREQEALAEQKKLAEGVRAESVGKFLEDFIVEVVPTLREQGDRAAARELLATTEHLALTTLSNSPATELGLQYRIASAYTSIGEFTNEVANYERIGRLLPLVPPGKLPVPLGKLRVDIATSTVDATSALGPSFEQLHALEKEFRSSTPPEWVWVARCLYQEGILLGGQEKTAEAASKLAEAHQIMPRGVDLDQESGINWQYAITLSEQEDWPKAIEVAQSGLRPWRGLTDRLRQRQQELIETAIGAYCAEGRLDEGLSFLAGQERVAESAGVPPESLHFLRRTRCQTLARGRRTREALDLMTDLATNSIGGSFECISAGCLAAGAGDRPAYRKWCALAIARYASGQEGQAASELARLLLADPQSPTLLHMVSELVARVEKAKDASIALSTGLRGCLEYRMGRYAEALSNFRREPPAVIPVYAGLARLDREFATWRFQIAMAEAQLGHTEDARTAYKEGLKVLEQTESGARRVDLGENYLSWYLQNAARMEAEQLFRAKGISVPSL